MVRVKVGEYDIRSDVYQAIQQASKRHKVPFNYMMAMAAKESNFDPNAKAKTSTATGLYQFIKKTWDEMWKDSKEKPLPTDPYASADAGARYAKQSIKILETEDLGFLYLGHFLGPNGALKLLNAIRENPNMLANEVCSASQINANKSVFFKSDGNLKTVQEIYDWSSKSIAKIIKKLGL